MYFPSLSPVNCPPYSSLTITIPLGTHPVQVLAAQSVEDLHLLVSRGFIGFGSCMKKRRDHSAKPCFVKSAYINIMLRIPVSALLPFDSFL